MEKIEVSKDEFKGLEVIVEPMDISSEFNEENVK